MATEQKVQPTTKVEETLVEKLARIELENEKLRNQEEDLEFRLDSYIEVMSLYPGKLNLSTEPSGKGKRFSFNDFGEVKRILYNDLASVMENYRSFMEKGYFYILNERIIRKHGLNDMYANILSKSMIEKILNCDSKLAVKLYQSATPAQRENIDSMLVQEMKVNELDLNIISQISKISGTDLSKLAEEAKALDAIPVT